MALMAWADDVISKRAQSGFETPVIMAYDDDRPHVGPASSPSQQHFNVHVLSGPGQ